MFDIYNARISMLHDVRKECLEQQQNIRELKSKHHRKTHIFRNVFNNRHQGKLA